MKKKFFIFITLVLNLKMTEVDSYSQLESFVHVFIALHRTKTQFKKLLKTQPQPQSQPKKSTLSENLVEYYGNRMSKKFDEESIEEIATSFTRNIIINVIRDIE